MFQEKSQEKSLPGERKLSGEENTGGRDDRKVSGADRSGFGGQGEL